MKLSGGYPLGLIQNGIPYNYPKLLKDIRTDVAVIGGGISGALMAYYLNKENVETIVVDGRTVGLGSTCASTSLLQYEIDTRLSELRERIGNAAADRAYRLCGDAIHTLHGITKKLRFADFSFAKSIYYAASAKHIPMLLSELEARKQAGFSVKWMDGEQLLQNYGVHAPAALQSELAAQTDAYALCHSLHQHNIRKGVSVYDRSFVSRIETKKRSVVLHTEEGYRIHCKKIVFANGYEVVKYIDKPIVKLSSTFAVASEQFDRKEMMPDQDVLLWSTGDPYLYAKCTRDQRLVIGGRDEDFFSPAKRDAMIERKAGLLVKDINQLLTRSTFKPEFRWAGTFGSTKDGLPFIGSYTGRPHAYFALGFGGNGITFSVIAARIVSGLISGRIKREPRFFSFDRV